MKTRLSCFIAVMILFSLFQVSWSYEEKDIDPYNDPFVYSYSDKPMFLFNFSERILAQAQSNNQTSWGNKFDAYTMIYLPSQPFSLLIDMLVNWQSGDSNIYTNNFSLNIRRAQMNVHFSEAGFLEVFYINRDFGFDSFLNPFARGGNNPLINDIPIRESWFGLSYTSELFNFYIKPDINPGLSEAGLDLGGLLLETDGFSVFAGLVYERRIAYSNWAGTYASIKLDTGLGLTAKLFGNLVYKTDDFLSAGSYTGNAGLDLILEEPFDDFNSMGLRTVYYRRDTAPLSTLDPGLVFSKTPQAGHYLYNLFDVLYDNRFQFKLHGCLNLEDGSYLFRPDAAFIIQASSPLTGAIGIEFLYALGSAGSEFRRMVPGGLEAVIKLVLELRLM